MPAYCDVALPVPLEQAFTYSLNGVVPVVGARVLVPFAGQKLMGVVVRVHSDAPAAGFEIKPVQQVLDEAALLSAELMKLGEWIAQYYIAPLGEVLRGMLPLMAEVKREMVYRITDAGRKILFAGAEQGSSRRSKKSPQEQDREYAVLNYLEAGETAKLGAIRSATQANKKLLDGMVKKKWLQREAVAEQRDARRMERWVVATDARLPKLTEKQTAILAELAAAGGAMPVRALRELKISEARLKTLAEHGLVRFEERAEDFLIGGVHAVGKLHAHEHELNPAQAKALAVIEESLKSGEFKPHLLYGVTGSGKTTVYFAAMLRALELGRSAILLVPEIGLTPAMAAQLYHAFGSEVALLHSALTPDERAEQWHRIRRGDARVVVGTRSAVFAPV